MSQRREVNKPKGRIAFIGIVIAVAVFALIISVGIRRKSREAGAPTPSKVPLGAQRSDDEVFATYGKSASCKDCHQKEYEFWKGSHHGLAERSIDPSLDRTAFESQPKIVHASQTSEVRIAEGKFQIVTAGLDGTHRAAIPERVIGEDPLRQFMIPAVGGRLQVAELSFDPHRTNWFDVYGEEDRRPGEWGHWTGRGMTWNSMCASCHNTRLRKHYIESSDSYATAMAEMSVGCEACHGPMGEHAKEARNRREGVGHGANGTKNEKESKPTYYTREQVFHTCGSCHSRRAELSGDFVPGDHFLDHYSLTIPDDTDVFYPDGQIRDEDYEYTAFLGSQMHAAGVRCIDCHEPHSGKTRVPGNGMCMMCHATGNLLDGLGTAGAARIGLAPKIDPLTHSHHKMGGAGDQCVDCHMPQTTYMQRHARRDHGFTIPDPVLTKETGIPNACARCHADRGLEWNIAAVDKWYGKRMERPTRVRAQILTRAKAGDVKSPAELTLLLKTETNGFWRAVAAGFVRRWAAESNVTRALLAGTDDPEPLVRAMSVRALEPLWQSDMPPVQEALKARLKDPVRAVRIDAAWALHSNIDTNSLAASDLLAYFGHSGDQPSGAMQNGVFRMDRGDLAGAIQYLRKAVQWDTNSAPPRNALAVALSLHGETGEAVEQLQAACRLAPRDAEMRFKLGLALNEAGKPEPARKALEDAVKLDPQFSQAWYNLGLAYNAGGQTDLAIEALVRAESIDGYSPQIPYARATILARLGRTEEAKKAARRALEIRRDYAEAVGLLQSLDH